MLISLSELARISHRLTVEARDRPAITSLRLLAVLNVNCQVRVSDRVGVVKRRASRTDGPLTHFASPRGEKSGLRATIEVSPSAAGIAAAALRGFGRCLRNPDAHWLGS